MSNENRRLSQAGANLIKAFESCLRPVGGNRFQAYRDPIGVLTIGWGHTNDNGRQFNANTIWTRAECDSEFLKDMDIFEKAVRRRVKVVLTQSQYDALVSFTFNCGEGNLAKSTLLRKVNAKDWDGAAREFAKWNKAGGHTLNGLTRRRASEALLFQGIPDADYDGRPDKVRPPHPEEVADKRLQDMPAQEPDSGGEGVVKSPAESTTIWAKAVEFVGAGGAAVVGAFSGLDWRVAMAIVAILAAGSFFVIRERLKKDDINASGWLGKLLGAY